MNKIQNIGLIILDITYQNIYRSYKAVKGWSLDNQPFTERYAFNTQYQNQDFLGQVLNVEAYYRNQKSRFVPYGYSADGVSVKQSQSNVDYAGIRSTLQSIL